MRITPVLVVSIALLSACGGDDDQAADGGVEPATTDSTVPDAPDEPETTDGGDGIPAADLPPECVEAPTEIEFSMDGFPQYAGTFPVEGAAAAATPIVPNGDGALDDLDFQGYKDLAAETDLLTYTQWIGNHPFGVDDLGFLGSVPDVPADKILFGLSVTPPTDAGLAAGDVVSSDDELAYDSITTFGTATVFLRAPEGVETYLYTSGGDETHGGTATVLYVDDQWLCVDWDLAGGTKDPEGTYSIGGVVLTPLVRGGTPFT